MIADFKEPRLARYLAPRWACSSQTLARDLKKLVAGGYEISRLAAFDMFPQTHHVETVAHLDLCAK